MGKKVFVIDLSVCNGCYCCQFVCKDEHSGNDWTPIAKPQPEIGQFWLKLDEKVRGTVPKVKVAYRPHLCMHCDDAPCMNACKIGGAIYKRDDGLVIVNPEKCTGCRSCVDACPYGAIYFNEDLNIAQKCTGCAHLLDNGWSEPRCADACPTLALRFMDEDDAKDLIAGAEVWQPELKDTVKPRVYYLNVPKRFIAGTPLRSRGGRGYHRRRLYPDGPYRQKADRCHRQLRRFLVRGPPGRRVHAGARVSGKSQGCQRPGHHRSRYQPGRYSPGVTG